MNRSLESGPPPVIGVDFDNTLVSYDQLMYCLSIKRGLIEPSVAANKRTVRDAIRSLPDGEIAWQRVQALAYGPQILEAVPANGVTGFFQLCARGDFKVYIVSHKTEFANYDETATNLQSAALQWLDLHRFLDGDHLGLSRENIYFELTRQQKVRRIQQLGCTHFVDDLEETFREEEFPDSVEKILYSSTPVDPLPPGIQFAGDWRQITEYFLRLI